MAPVKLLGSRSEGSLRSSATTAFASTGGYSTKSFTDSTIKLPSLSTSWSKHQGYHKAMLKPIDTTWDQSFEDVNSQKFKLKKMGTRVDDMADVFAKDIDARANQLQTMDDLHLDQMQRMDLLAADLDHRNQEICEYIENWIQDYRSQLHEVDHDLHEQLTEHVTAMLPRLDALESRGRVLRALIEEEKEARIEQNANILQPAVQWLEALRTDLARESKIQKARALEIQDKVNKAEVLMNEAITSEVAVRETRFMSIEEPEENERERLEKKIVVENGLFERLDKQVVELEVELGKENEHRVLHQDPIVLSLMDFMKRFHRNIEEAAQMG
eukprot:TRINITY_DN67463_c0_g1_i1.p1 TRINITY_DN67463_c0_g1~~TRINITY_DN67463_c0_g1_i1.p1  ORF type:complete len:329 (+),score=72.22 TRINITY_DN67463_c0_g1_i1:45-1031(+)